MMGSFKIDSILHNKLQPFYSSVQILSTREEMDVKRRRENKMKKKIGK